MRLDAGGGEAAAQAIHARGHRVRIARLPEGKDLNDFVTAETSGGV